MPLVPLHRDGIGLQTSCGSIYMAVPYRKTYVVCQVVPDTPADLHREPSNREVA